jgi:hypothetical protein
MAKLTVYNNNNIQEKNKIANQLKRLDNKINTNSNDIATIENDLLDTKQQLSQSIDDLQTQLDTHTTSINTNSSDIENNTTSIANINSSITQINTELDTKITAPEPTGDGIKGLVYVNDTDDPEVLPTWNDFDTDAPYSPATTDYVKAMNKQIEGVNFLGIVEFSGFGEPNGKNITTAQNGDVYIDNDMTNADNSLWKYDGTQWQPFALDTPQTSGDFFRVNMIIDTYDGGANISGRLTWVHDINDETFYWYYELNIAGGGGSGYINSLLVSGFTYRPVDKGFIKKPTTDKYGFARITLL